MRRANAAPLNGTDAVSHIKFDRGFFRAGLDTVDVSLGSRGQRSSSMPTQGSRRPIRAAVFAVGVMAGSVLGADAQTTVVLNVPGSQVTDTMIQGGINAKTNFSRLDAVAT